MNKKQLRILIAPLDWGLGHVTRSIPLIRHILSRGHAVVFAGNESQQKYMRSLYPQLHYVPLEGYNVSYSRSPYGMIPRIALQIPKIRKKIREEQAWLQETIKTLNIDAVLSDNRYGLYSKLVPCVFITHQLQVRTGYGKHLDHLLLRLHYRFIEKFTHCWIVDEQADQGLSGSLAHPSRLPRIGADYIGLLSQCAGKTVSALPGKEFYVLILLSGTEPQRSMLSELLWKKAVKSGQHIIFVEGSEKATAPASIPAHISYHKRLNAGELTTAIEAASIVICRSGYSSIMDLIALNKKAILIPTPGQTEQEYLGRHLGKQKIFMVSEQKKFDIQTSLVNASLFPFVHNKFSNSFQKHKAVLDHFLAGIGEGSSK
ncbi:MAG: glycosyl transferase family 28 [Chitinophagaceae bacterium]|nr:glycosyl transferase family 28 [Chitinophagaceae bacterium]